MTYIIETVQGAKLEAGELLKANMLAADQRRTTKRIRRILDETGKVVYGEAMPTRITRTAAKEPAKSTKPAKDAAKDGEGG